MAGVTQAWGSRFGFLMASVGFAVGLGNIWRFPYITGENGGSAFVLVYLLCAFGIGVPILMAELMLGRRGGFSPPASVRAIAAADGRSTRWSAIGYLNLLTAFFILIAYGVVAGWVLYYLYGSASGALAGFDADASTAHFAALLARPHVLVFWSLVTLMIAGFIIYKGVQNGIERAVKVLMPLLFFLLLALVVFNIVVGGMPETIRYLLAPDFSKLSSAMVLAAIGQAFFSIGVAMAGMMMFGAYLPEDVSIAQSAIVVVFADTLVALLAGFVIFPMVFHNGLDPAGGTGLIFQTLPVAFAQMPAGQWVGTTFFLLLSVAAITSVVGLCEPLCAWLAERFGWSRHKAAIVLTLTATGCGVVSVLSYNIWANVRLLGLSLGTIIDFLPNQIMLPLGGLLIALFAGWFVNAQAAEQELAMRNRVTFSLWHQLMRWVVVPAVAIILVSGLTS
ncbi:MAG: sodium-dependent transporter [bacterium]